jgi:hypothetical protein
MNQVRTFKISPQAIVQTIKVNLMRRPLWHHRTVMDCLDLTREQLNERIQNGQLAFAFEVGTAKRISEPRILSLCVIENQLGPIPGIGSTRNMGLSEVIDKFILPQRDIRSTELCRLLSLERKAVYKMAAALVKTQEPIATDGPNSYTVFSRASVAEFLAARRIS